MNADTITTVNKITADVADIFNYLYNKTTEMAIPIILFSYSIIINFFAAHIFAKTSAAL
ncbi:hypothetical protein M1E08_15545 [Erwinia sp. PK3-005]|uniref:Uncharacterized protein n=1 Tax=Mixta hanseatica TaxID=2872648 RepID=A0ABY4R9S2_9GAMM|nr:hypothetical protein [Mixta hanseatica]UQY45163.1 hypothetical protein K6958_05655 [Mixta hanseatica]